MPRLQLIRWLAAACRGLTLASVTLAAAGFGAELPVYERVRELAAPRTIADVALTDQNGQPFRLSQLQGRVVLVLFGFTNCPDICPTTMEVFRQLHDSGSIDTDKVKFVLISVDGERDTPAAMKAYVEKFSPDFIGLTAKPTDVKPLARSFAAAFFQGAHDANGHYTVAHSSQAFVLDAAGQLRAESHSASPDAMAGIAAALLAEVDR